MISDTRQIKKVSNKLYYQVSCYDSYFKTTYSTTVGLVAERDTTASLSKEERKELLNKASEKFDKSANLFVRGVVQTFECYHSRVEELEQQLLNKSYRRRSPFDCYMINRYSWLRELNYKQQTKYFNEIKSIDIATDLRFAVHLSLLESFAQNGIECLEDYWGIAQSNEELQWYEMALIYHVDTLIAILDKETDEDHDENAEDESKAKRYSFLRKYQALAVKAHNFAPEQSKAVKRRATRQAKKQATTKRNLSKLLHSNRIKSYLVNPDVNTNSTISNNYQLTKDAQIVAYQTSQNASVTQATLTSFFTNQITLNYYGNCYNPYNTNNTNNTQHHLVNDLTSTQASASTNPPASKKSTAQSSKTANCSSKPNQTKNSDSSKQPNHSEQEQPNHIEQEHSNHSEQEQPSQGEQTMAQYILNQKSTHINARRLLKLITKSPYFNRSINVGDLVILGVLTEIPGLIQLLGKQMLVVISLIATFYCTALNSINQIRKFRFSSFLGDIVTNRELYEASQTFSDDKVHLGVETAMFRHIVTLYPDSMNRVHIDGTNYRKNMREAKGIFHINKSKNDKYEPIINQNIMVNSRGFVVQSMVCPGNVRETISFRRLVTLFYNHFKKKKPRIIFTCDAGISSQANRSLVDHYGGYYVMSITCRGKSKEKTVRQLIDSKHPHYFFNLDTKCKAQALKRTYTIGKTEKTAEGIIQLATWNRIYAKREKEQRDLATKDESFNFIQKKLPHRLNYYDVELLTGAGKTISKDEIKFKRNDDQILQATKYDGLHAVESNISDAKPLYLLLVYKLHNKIEKVFSFFKSIFNNDKLRHKRSDSCVGKCNLTTLIYNCFNSLEQVTGGKYKKATICTYLNALKIIRVNESTDPNEIRYKFSIDIEEAIYFFKDLGIEFDDQEYTLEQIIEKLLGAYRNALKKAGLASKSLPDFIDNSKSILEKIDEQVAINIQELKREALEKEDRDSKTNKAKDLKIEVHSNLITTQDLCKVWKMTAIKEKQEDQGKQVKEQVKQENQEELGDQEKLEDQEKQEKFTADQATTDIEYKELTVEDFDELIANVELLTDDSGAANSQVTNVATQSNNNDQNCTIEKQNSN